jgi:hypothetical protein
MEFFFVVIVLLLTAGLVPVKHREDVLVMVSLSKRSSSVPFRFDILCRAAVKKHFGHGHVPQLSDAVQAREAAPVAGIYICPAIEQEQHFVETLVLDGIHERRGALAGPHVNQ